MYKVAILAFEGVSLFELSCATELFASIQSENENWYASKVVAFEEGPFMTNTGLLIEPSLVHDFEGFDILVVPSWPIHGPQAKLDLALAILQYAARKKRILSFSTGAFLLAELGVLKNKQATTHWQYAEIFTERFSDIDFVDDALFTYDGQVGCSGASAAAFDLGLEVVRKDYGIEAANTISKRLVFQAHRSGGQTQIAENSAFSRPNALAETIEWATKNLSLNISIDDMADRASMSRRSFDRHFRDLFDISPHEWLTQQKINHAEHLLRHTNDTLDTVAQKSGFTNALSLRHNFKKAFKLSPNEYRVKSQKKLKV